MIKRCTFFSIMLSIALLMECTIKGKRGEGEKRESDWILWWNPLNNSGAEYDPFSDTLNASGFSKDIDLDGKNEFVLSLSTGVWYKKNASLFILNTDNGEIRWGNDAYGGIVTAGDINSDGQDEILAFTEGEINELDGVQLYSPVPVIYLTAFSSNKDTLWTTTVNGPKYSPEYIDMVLTDVERDGILDVFVVTSSKITVNDKPSSTSSLQRIRSNDGTILWKIGASSFDWIMFGEHSDMYFTSIAVGDLNSDGVLDVVVGEETEKAVIAFDGVDGSQLWKAILGIKPEWITIGDVDSDGEIEVITGSDSIVYKNIPDYSIPEFWVEMIPGNGIIINGKDGGIKLDISSLDLIENPYPAGQSIKSYTFLPALGDINGDGFLDIITKMKFFNVITDGPKILDYMGQKQYMGLFESSQNLKWWKLLYENNSDTTTITNKTEYRGKDSAIYWNMLYDFPLSDVLFIDLNHDSIPDLLDLEHYTIQSRNGRTGEGIFWYSFAKDDEWIDTAVIKIIGIFDINSDGLSEIVALAYNGQWPEKVRVVALKTGSVYPSDMSLKPWPMERHDPHRTGNYNFVE